MSSIKVISIFLKFGNGFEGYFILFYSVSYFNLFLIYQVFIILICKPEKCNVNSYQ